MQVLVIVSNDVIHDARVVKEAQALRAAGHTVRFIGWDRSGRREARETWDGFDIRYVRTRGLLRALGRDLFRNPAWWRRAYRLAMQAPFDVVHCHDLDTLSIGVRLKKTTGRPLVYDVHEVFAYMIEEDVPRVVSDYALRMEAQLAPAADRVIAVNDAIRQYIEGVVEKPAVVVRNVQNPMSGAYQPPPASPFTLLYIGTLHKSRFIIPAIEVIADMPDARLVIGGSKALTPTVRDLCARHPNTIFVGPVPSERVLPMTLEAHAVLSLFDPAHRINQVGLPNKIFEAMAAGRPSIVTQGLPMGDLVEREGCGLAVDYTKEGLRSAVRKLMDDPALAERLGRAGFEAAKREYNWAMEHQKLVEVYENLGRLS